MMEHDEKIERYYALKPFDFPVLIGLSVNQDSFDTDQRPIMNIELELAPNAKGETKHLILFFRDVSNLKLIQPSINSLQMIRLEILSVKSWQWDRVNYQVFDGVMENFSLQCGDFDASIK